VVGGACVLAGCSKKEPCPPGAECITIAGGVSYCACPKGFRTQQDGSCDGKCLLVFNLKYYIGLFTYLYKVIIIFCN
jgi:hypothetical protein